MAVTSNIKSTAKVGKKKDKKWTWKKPKGKPKRPLSAYNLFFRQERRRLTSLGESCDAGNHGLITDQTVSSAGQTEIRSHPGGNNLAKIIAKNWKCLSEESCKVFKGLAAIEKTRYQRELAVWQRSQEEKGLQNQPQQKMKVMSAMVSAIPTPPMVALQRQVTPDTSTYGATPVGPNFIAYASSKFQKSYKNESLAPIVENDVDDFCTSASALTLPSTSESMGVSTNAQLPQVGSISASNDSSQLASFLDQFNKSVLNKCSKTMKPSFVNKVEPEAKVASANSERVNFSDDVQPISDSGEKGTSLLDSDILDKECADFVLSTFNLEA